MESRVPFTPYIRLVLLMVAFYYASAVAATAPASNTSDSLADYVKAGGPALDQAWTAADYSKLRELVTAQAIPLPRLASPTAAVFSRLTNPENFEAIVKSPAPLPERMRRAAVFNSAVGQEMLSLYFGARQSGSDVQSELARVLAYAMRMAARFESLFRELEASPAAAAQPEFRTMQQQATASSNGILDGTARILQGPEFGGDNRTIVVRAFGEFFGVANQRLSNAMLMELRERFSAMSESEQNADAKAEMAKILATCTTALQTRSDRSGSTEPSTSRPTSSSSATK